MAHTIQVACVAGARPNFMKVAPLLAEMAHRPIFRPTLIHTGQHSSPEMSELFFRDLDLPRPDVWLGVPAGSQTEQTARIMLALEEAWRSEPPDIVLVVGDVSSTLAAALVAVRLGIRLAHVEAGLRSFDRTMPEEINRVLTDAIADYLFATERSGVANLLREGIPESKIYFAGNVMIDTLLRHLEKARESNVLARLGLVEGGYAVATMHRPANVDRPEVLREFMRMLARLSESIPVVFPVHPRTRQGVVDWMTASPALKLIDPMGYLDFLRLTSGARIVLTDSGGIQEETTILNVPCLTMRQNTERPVTIAEGTNRLVGTDPGAILEAATAELACARPVPRRRPELWDGKAAGRIIDAIESACAGGR